MYTVLFGIEAFGTLIGVIWLVYWMRFNKQLYIVQHHTSLKKLISTGKHITLHYLVKLFGRYAAGLLVFGEESALLTAGARFGGRFAARYGTLGVGLDFLGEGSLTYLIIGSIVIIELLMQIKKRPEILYDARYFSQTLLEIFVMFSVVGLVSDLLFL